MDDDKNKPGVTQIPLIQDLVFDPSQALKSPGKHSGSGKKPYPKPSRKSGSYPPGYDPDTVDLFEDILDPVERQDEDSPDVHVPDPGQQADNLKSELEENLRAELTDELGSILEQLKDHPGT